MDSGDLIPDDVVLEALFSEILGPAIDDAAGLIIDGFPRTESQVTYACMVNGCIPHFMDDSRPGLF